MAKVRFMCDGKNATVFILNTRVETDYVPMIGDIIETSYRDFSKASFRIRPFHNHKDKFSKSYVGLKFSVIKRTYSISFNQWDLICEPTAESLIYLLKTLKTN